VFFSFRGPRTIAAALALLLGIRLYLGDFRWWDLATIPAILAVQPFAEWLIHRYILHFTPRSLGGRVFDLAIARSHRAHHRDPWILEKVFIPLRGGAVGLLLFAGLWYAVLPTVELFTSMLLATVAAAFFYEWVHYLTHTAYHPRTALYRRMWRHHRLHHFKNEHYWLGVTTNLGDRILGTYPDLAEVPTSPTCRTLGVETSADR
jgi:hypothetical protein